MSSKITMAVLATAMLASTIASPALAQRPPTAQQGALGGTYQGYPLTDWYRADSWARDQRIINEAVVNGTMIGADAQPSMEPSQDSDSSWRN
jgi:hypothetical protein